MTRHNSSLSSRALIIFGRYFPMFHCPWWSIRDTCLHRPDAYTHPSNQEVCQVLFLPGRASSLVARWHLQVHPQTIHSVLWCAGLLPERMPDILREVFSKCGFSFVKDKGKNELSALRASCQLPASRVFLCLSNFLSLSLSLCLLLSPYALCSMRPYALCSLPSAFRFSLITESKIYICP